MHCATLRVLGPSIPTCSSFRCILLHCAYMPRAFQLAFPCDDITACTLILVLQPALHRVGDYQRVYESPRPAFHRDSLTCVLKPSSSNLHSLATSGCIHCTLSVPTYVRLLVGLRCVLNPYQSPPHLLLSMRSVCFQAKDAKDAITESSASALFSSLVAVVAGVAATFMA